MQADSNITYNHMQEEKSIASKYFKMNGSFKKQATTLFLVEELLVVGMLCGLIYLFVQ
jgi:hypothetical protein